jgi:hypothetical protein
MAAGREWLNAAKLCCFYLLAGMAMRSPICTSVQPVFFRIAPTSPRGLGAGLICVACLGCPGRSFSSRVYCLASALT